tara:strand:+ start:847 stop:1650 length:804 start_codon:yes stop_codon:yes gene_type:complete
LNEVDSILSHRLFGYGIPYQVEIDSFGKFSPIRMKIDEKALELSKTLKFWLERAPQSLARGSIYSYSMPFGRCGLGALPLEHLQIFDAEEAYLDVLSEDGFSTKLIGEKDTILIKPETVIRLRLKSKGDRRAFVAFQTEDQTPLSGNAGPYTLNGVSLPSDPFERFMASHEAFEQTSQMEIASRNRELSGFFTHMSSNIKNRSKMQSIQEKARSVGSYDKRDQTPFFSKQKSLLTTEVLELIARRDQELFRFPGMFGAVAPLFPLLK